MLNDAWNAAPQIQEYLKMNHILPPFTDQDWNQLGQIRIVLAEFDRYILELSTDIPQISQSLAIYYQLFDLLQEVQEREGKFKDFDADVANAAKSAMRKYDKYYTLMDDLCDILYITMLLDPRFKKLVLEHELRDEAQDIITAMQEQLEIQYPITHKPELFIASEEPGPSVTLQNPDKTIVSEMISKIKAKSQKSAEKPSDIARYLNSDVVEFDEKKRDWIYTWWRGHIDEYPRMAAAARDYLAVPAAEVNIERLFNTGRDLLGLRRWSLSSGTMRKLLILKDSLCKRGTCEFPLPVSFAVGGLALPYAVLSPPPSRIRDYINPIPRHFNLAPFYFCIFLSVAGVIVLTGPADLQLVSTIVAFTVAMHGQAIAPSLHSWYHFPSFCELV
ncbi:hypothetical protein TSTA_009450 [Talaromyces stipitatus ATCC 10500]|uniref:HAT C-terminal dimerisation domain-containing protein n=1 Tax=Talaromyces stipitatus (strain ATCC 10500 / CBS 375.48 / QM 6759 / NRRL 1006) TaxID=441959 RepID=B8MFV6_TALSN|nr:uncharacterized protein TSTA_009450 [Talaromyces stipitatus ATCC 10500]EED15823.1 hypothetical protein TSTA_009450 [Talaromyces stipitatus ATCC 10500]